MFGFFGVDVTTALTETTIKWFARSSIRYSIVHAIPNGHGAPCVDISIIFLPSWMGMRGFIYFHFPVKNLVNNCDGNDSSKSSGFFFLLRKCDTERIGESAAANLTDLMSK